MIAETRRVIRISMEIGNHPLTSENAHILEAPGQTIFTQSIMLMYGLKSFFVRQIRGHTNYDKQWDAPVEALATVF